MTAWSAVSAVFLSLAAGQAAFAQPIAAGGEFQVNTYTSGDGFESGDAGAWSLTVEPRATLVWPSGR